MNEEILTNIKNCLLPGYTVLSVARFHTNVYLLRTMTSSVFKPVYAVPIFWLSQKAIAYEL